MAAAGWRWTWQRCRRYKYQKVLVHTTNRDHLVPSTPSLTDIPPHGLPTGTRAGARAGDDYRHGEAA
jgi:hypothetical protein